MLELVAMVTSFVTDEVQHAYTRAQFLIYFLKFSAIVVGSSIFAVLLLSYGAARK